MSGRGTSGKSRSGKAVRVLLSALAIGALAGCWESPDITVHRAGEYKGGVDPLLAEPAAVREARLAERFNLVQSDR